MPKRRYKYKFRIISYESN